MFGPVGTHGPGPVLGIDPGVTHCGYGAVARDGPRATAVAFGVLRPGPDTTLAERLGGLLSDLEALVHEVQPSVVAVERVLFQVNAATAISVGQASGLALAAAARAGVPVVAYSPNEVKLAVTGDGAGSKAQVQAMVTRLLHLTDGTLQPDAADALALALCHCWQARLAAASRAADEDAPAGQRLAAAIHAAQAADPRRAG